MGNLIITTGLVSLDIERDGENVGTFKFNPEDIVTTRKVLDLKKELIEKEVMFNEEAKKCESDDEGIALLEEVSNYFRDSIDRIFGSGSSVLLFGEARTLDMIKQLFEGITPFYEQASNKRISEASSKQFTSKK